jgi:hypothetical protein
VASQRQPPTLPPWLDDEEHRPQLDALNAALREWRQGDVFTVEGLLAVDPTLSLVHDPTAAASRVVNCDAPQIVLVSQTCDAILPAVERPLVQICPVVTLEGNQARLARRSESPRYVAVPDLGDDQFADLDDVHTVEKSCLRHFPRTPGVLGTPAQRRFGFAVGRKFSRFPFPDDVHQVLRPFAQSVASKYDRETSAEGQVFHRTVALRVAPDDPNWVRRPISFDVLVLVDEDWARTPTENDDEPDAPPSLRNWASVPDRAPAVIAQKLVEYYNGSPTDEEISWLWNMLCDAWTRGASAAARNVPGVEAVAFQPLHIDELKYRQLQASDLLDLDYLSEE